MDLESLWTVADRARGRSRLNARALRSIGLAALLLFLAQSTFAQPVVGVLGITREIAPIEQRLREIREVSVGGYVFRVGKLDGRSVVVGRSGAGKVNAAIITTLLIGEFKPQILLFSGTAGAIDPALRPGDVVIGTSVAQHDAGTQAADGIRLRGLRNPLTGELDPLLVPAPEPLLLLARRLAKELRLPSIRIDDEDHTPRIVEGVIVTGDVFVSDEVRRETLRSTLGAAAVEMEGAAVVQTCRQFGVSCLVVRGITDRADGQAQNSYDKFIGPASEHAARLVAAIIAGLFSQTP
jgi:adenosylhomocysteine nucleosidase